MATRSSTEAAEYIGYVWRVGRKGELEITGRKTGLTTFRTYGEARAVALGYLVRRLRQTAEMLVLTIGATTYEEFRGLNLRPADDQYDWWDADEGSVRAAASALLKLLKFAVPADGGRDEADEV